MKKILITGQNSYMGNQFEEWVSQWPDDYQITKISVRNDDWKNQNWNTYDVVLNVAGIAHQKITKENENDYYKVNRDLAVSLANKAKDEGVTQFIQTSTMSVFGKNRGEITEKTTLEPKSAYGQSKMEADNLIMKLQESNFIVSIVRPPMVYGYKSPGNYRSLSHFSKITPIFPNYDNKRSMIYIKNLSEFFRTLIDTKSAGYFYPQNRELVKTSEMVKKIAEVNNKRIYLIKFVNPLIKLLSNVNIVQKVFGNLYYHSSMSNFEELNYSVFEFNESIILSEKENSNA